MQSFNKHTKTIHISSKVVLSDNSAKKIGLSSVDEIKKGALITLPCYPEGVGYYRILAVNGTQIKVVAMHSTEKSPFNRQKYQNSDLDNKMTQIYNEFPENIKRAIVPQTITQSLYDYKLVKRDEITVGIRNVYVLDVDDVVEYLGNNYASQDLLEMFFNTRKSIPKYVWLRSAYAGNSNYAFYVDGYYGIVNIDYATNDYGVRPAFVLDLAKLNV